MAFYQRLEQAKAQPMQELCAKMGHPPLDEGRHNRCRMLKHPSDSTPSMKFYPETNSFFCFGCKSSGSTVDYVMGTLPNTTLIEAVVFIEKVFGLSVVRNPTMFRTRELKKSVARLKDRNNRSTYDPTAYAREIERKLRTLVDSLAEESLTPEESDSLFSEADLMYHDLDTLVQKLPSKDVLDSFEEFYQERFSSRAELMQRIRGEL